MDELSDILTTKLLSTGFILDLLRNASVAENRYPDVLLSTGGRPAYNITKGQIEQLRETGMNWRSVAKVLRISDSTLYRRRLELNVTDTFSLIEDDELDRVIQDILRLTPYSGETYVKGALQGRGITVQRARIRASLFRIDPVGRAIRRRRQIVRRTYNVTSPNNLWHIDFYINLYLGVLSFTGALMAIVVQLFIYIAVQTTKPHQFWNFSEKVSMNLAFLRGSVVIVGWKMWKLHGT